MSNNKWLYQFKVNREKDVQNTDKTKNEKGDEISITKNVKKNVPVEFFMKKPNRRLYEDGELFFGVTLSEGIKVGLLTRQLLAKRYDNDGGFMSEPDKEKYAELYRSLYDKENDTQKAQLNLENLSEASKSEKVSRLLMEASEIRRELQEFETFRSAIFDQTAENRAKNKTLMWWILHLAYKKEDDSDKINALFGEGNYESKLDEYDKIEESSDSCLAEAVKKFAYFISFWYGGQLNNEEEFKNLENLAFPKEEDPLVELENKAEDKKVEEKKVEESKAEESKAEEKKVEVAV